MWRKSKNFERPCVVQPHPSRQEHISPRVVIEEFEMSSQKAVGNKARFMALKVDSKGWRRHVQNSQKERERMPFI